VDCSSVTVEFQALIVRDVVILVVQIGNQFSARHVLRSDVVVHLNSIRHISGHPSAAGRAQDRESSPVRDRRSTTVPRHSKRYKTVCAFKIK